MDPSPNLLTNDPVHLPPPVYPEIPLTQRIVAVQDRTVFNGQNYAGCFITHT